MSIYLQYMRELKKAQQQAALRGMDIGNQHRKATDDAWQRDKENTRADNSAAWKRYMDMLDYQARLAKGSEDDPLFELRKKKLETEIKAEERRLETLELSKRREARNAMKSTVGALPVDEEGKIIPEYKTEMTDEYKGMANENEDIASILAQNADSYAAGEVEEGRMPDVAPGHHDVEVPVYDRIDFLGKESVTPTEVEQVAQQLGMKQRKLVRGEQRAEDKHPLEVRKLQANANKAEVEAIAKEKEFSIVPWQVADSQRWANIQPYGKLPMAAETSILGAKEASARISSLQHLMNNIDPKWLKTGIATDIGKLQSKIISDPAYVQFMQKVEYTMSEFQKSQSGLTVTDAEYQRLKTIIPSLKNPGASFPASVAQAKALMESVRMRKLLHYHNAGYAQASKELAETLRPGDYVVVYDTKKHGEEWWKHPEFVQVPSYDTRNPEDVIGKIGEFKRRYFDSGSNLEFGGISSIQAIKAEYAPREKGNK